MLQRSDIRLETLREYWQDSPLKGGLLGILWVALATGALAGACAAIAFVVTRIY